jgi:hypothetical protein
VQGRFGSIRYRYQVVDAERLAASVAMKLIAAGAEHLAASGAGVHFEEMDALEGFTLRNAPPDRSCPALPDELGPKPNWSEAINDMATATNNRQPRDVVDFPPNAPVTVALKYSQGRTISGQYGERVMFTLTDGRVMFLAPEVAGRIESLGINVRESFTITRGSTGQNSAPATWDIARVEGEQPNGTLVLQAPDSPTPKPAASAATPDGGIARKQSGSALMDEANALVDSFAQVLERSLTLYQGRIKPDEVKALVVTAYIQRSKFSSVA